jgi:hypothetical protein
MMNQLSLVTNKRRFAAAANNSASEQQPPPPAVGVGGGVIIDTIGGGGDASSWDPDERIREWKAYFESRAEVPGVIGRGPEIFADNLIPPSVKFCM